MSQFISLKEVNKATQYSVSGFLREQRHMLLPLNISYYNIPPIVMHLCVMYFYQQETFDKHGDNMILNEKQNVVQMIDHGWNSVYGKYLIKTDKPHLYEWTVQILERHSDILIGIAGSNRKWVNDDFAFQFDSNHMYYAYGCAGKVYGCPRTKTMHSDNDWAYNSLGGRIVNPDAVTEGDFIKVVLEIGTNENEIRFYKNNRMINWFRYVKFSTSQKCYFAVSMGAMDDRVKLVDFIITQR
eukprot:277554_1